MEIEDVINFSRPSDENKKRIWMYWHDGIENAPEIVKESYFSWVFHNPDYEVVLLDDKVISSYLGFDFSSLFISYPNIELGFAGKSDILRIVLLHKYGGVWVDATTICLQPINVWLPSDNIDFFIFRQPKSCRDRKMVSWFMYSSLGNDIIKGLLFEVLLFLSKNRVNKCVVNSVNKFLNPPDELNLVSRDETGYDYLNFCEGNGVIPYFWMFYLWNEVVKKHPSFERKLELQVNNYVQPGNEFDTFKESFVSKQTYRDSGPRINKIRSERIRYSRSIRLNKVISIHLPKTAGTYFRHVLTQSAPDKVDLDYGDRIMDYSIDAINYRNSSYLKPRSDKLICHGHFYAKKYLHLNNVDFVTVLREPLELAISLYNYLNNRKDFNFIIEKAKNNDFHDFCRHPWFVNITTTILDGLNVTDFSLIGFQHDMDDFVERFEIKYDVSLNGEVSRDKSNITEITHVKRDDLSDSFVQEFKRMNERDYLFYGEALRVYGKPN